MMKSGYSWICLLIFVIGGGLQAQTIRVEEVRTHIHELPVSGFRMLLNQPQRVIRTGIETYLAAFSEQPFSFEQSLIYESLTYPPITDAHPITLYYVFEETEGIFTQLTLIALYDHTRSINTRQTPDLSLRLLLDATEMIRKMTGDELDFSHLFELTDGQQLQLGFGKRKATHISDFYLSHQPDRIGAEEAEAVLLRQNPFKTPAPADFATDEQVLEQLAVRFHTYMERKDPTNPSPFVGNEAAGLVQLYRDSVRQMSEELATYKRESAFSKLAETSAMTAKGREKLRADSLASRLLVAQALNRELTRTNQRLDYARTRNTTYEQQPGDSTALKLQRLQEQMIRLRTEFTLRQQELTERNQELRNQLTASQEEAQSLLSQLLKAQTRVQAAESAEELARIRAEKEAAESELAQLHSANSNQENNLSSQVSDLQKENSQLLDQLLDAQLRYRDLQARMLEFEGGRARLEQGLTEKDRLNSELATELRLVQKELTLAETRLRGKETPSDTQSEIGKLYRENRRLQVFADSLRQENDRLNPNSISAREQALRSQQQREALIQSRQRIREKELELEKREKLMAQREKFMARQEANPEKKELLEQLNEVQARLLMLESGTWRLYPRFGAGTATVDGNEFPTVSVHSLLKTKNHISQTIREYFARMQIRPTSGTDLRFESISLPDLHPDPVSLTFFLEADAESSIQIQCLAQTRTGIVLSDPENPYYERFITLLELVFAEDR